MQQTNLLLKKFYDSSSETNTLELRFFLAIAPSKNAAVGDPTPSRRARRRFLYLFSHWLVLFFIPLLAILYVEHGILYSLHLDPNVFLFISIYEIVV
ncbi:unnamed protein product [Lathyrus oleraceus]